MAMLPPQEDDCRRGEYYGMPILRTRDDSSGRVDQPDVRVKCRPCEPERVEMTHRLQTPPDERTRDGATEDVPGRTRLIVGEGVAVRGGERGVLTAEHRIERTGRGNAPASGDVLGVQCGSQPAHGPHDDWISVHCERDDSLACER